MCNRYARCCQQKFYSDRNLTHHLRHLLECICAIEHLLVSNAAEGAGAGTAGVAAPAGGAGLEKIAEPIHMTRIAAMAPNANSKRLALAFMRAREASLSAGSSVDIGE